MAGSRHRVSRQRPVRPAKAGRRLCVEAAGGVVVRGLRGDEPKLALVHRPRHDDWSLPKGKLEPGETSEQAALREVREETGFACRLGPELASSRYTDGRGRAKLVRYWLMEPVDGEFAPSGEVDELRWCGAGEAQALLTYERDRALAEEALRRAAELSGEARS